MKWLSNWRSRADKSGLTWLNVLGELVAFAVALPLLLLLPRGDGRPVLVIPAYTASDSLTLPLRFALRLLGYQPHGWGLGVNRGLHDETITALTDRLDDLHRRHDTPVSVVGWSLGGVFGRHLARVRPGMVRDVITLGSPIRSMEARRGWSAPKIPTTSIYSKNDSVVHWMDSFDDSEAGRRNIEVRGTHYGLAHNPRVIKLIAQHLAKSTTAPVSGRDTGETTPVRALDI